MTDRHISFRGRGPSNPALVEAVRAGDVPEVLRPYLHSRTPLGLPAPLSIDSNTFGGELYECVHWPSSAYHGDIPATSDQAAALVTWFDALAPGWRDLPATYGGGPAIAIEEPSFRAFPDGLSRGMVDAQLDVPGDTLADVWSRY